MVWALIGHRASAGPRSSLGCPAMPLLLQDRGGEGRSAWKGEEASGWLRQGDATVGAQSINSLPIKIEVFVSCTSRLAPRAEYQSRLWKWLLVLILRHFNDIPQLFRIAFNDSIYVPVSTAWAVFVGFWMGSYPYAFPPKAFILRCSFKAWPYFAVWFWISHINSLYWQRIENLTYPKCFEIFRWLLGNKYKKKRTFKILLTKSSSPQNGLCEELRER